MRKMMKKGWMIAGIFLVIFFVYWKSNQTKMVGNMQFKEVQELIRTAQKIYEEDNGELWGKKMNPRIMVIDDETKMFIANENSDENNFTSYKDMYIGKLPDDVVIGNSVLSYGGKQWAQIRYSEMIDYDTTLGIYLHEMFHNNQAMLGHTLDMKLDEETNQMSIQNDLSDLDFENMNIDSLIGYHNTHMDHYDARVLIKLEWAALNKAIKSEGKDKEDALMDALAFRQERRNLYPDKITDENSFEIQEGLADYTSNKLLYPTEKELIHAADISWNRMLNEEETPSYVRTFAYLSGYMYGLLLDQSQKKWRNEITVISDLGEMTKEAYGIDQIQECSYKTKEKYGYNEINTIELDREKNNELLISKYKDMFENGEILLLPLSDPQMAVDPNAVWNLEGEGDIYHSAKITDEWGKLETTDGAVLVMDDYSYAIVSLHDMQQENNEIKGAGWKIELNPKYKVQVNENGIKEIGL